MDGKAFQRVDNAQLLAMSSALPPGTMAVIDFDGTLLLRNSTQLYLQTLRPRFIAKPLLSLLELVRPWLVLPGDDGQWLYRDWIRVVLLTLLLPWSPWLWRRACASIARDQVNAGLRLAFAPRPAGTVVVATYGFRFLVAPLLAAMDCPWPLSVSASFLTAFQLRRQGKAEAVRNAIGMEALSRSVLVTDSKDDADFLPLCWQAFLVTPEVKVSTMIAGVGYLPLQYIQNCKGRGENAVFRIVLFYDLCTLFFAYGFASPRILPCLLGLFFFQLAFWTVYELGNWENDVLGAALEDKPDIPPGFEQWKHRVRPRQAWVWACALALPCAFCFASALEPGAGTWFGLPSLLRVTELLVTLLVYLVVSRLCYAFYNRVDTKTRVFVYPLMQIGKGVGLIAILPVAPAGLILMVSVLIVREMRYVAYRYAETREGLNLPVNLHILASFVFFSVIFVVTTHSAPNSFWLVAGVIVLWHIQRGRRDLLQVWHAFEWLPDRRHSGDAGRMAK